MFPHLSPKFAIPIWWGLLGAVLCGSIGAGYASWWYYSPESREAYIREELSLPHFDSPRYVAGIVAWQYRTLGSLLRQYGLTAAVAGGGLGILIGRGRYETSQFRALEGSTKFTPEFDLLEALAIIALTFDLIVMLAPTNYGLVYYQGKDQFHWLWQLEIDEELEKREAVAAITQLLKNPPFPCRSTLIPALAEAGPLAEAALPILERLSHDEEIPVREVALKAKAEIQEGLKKSRASK